MRDPLDKASGDLTAFVASLKLPAEQDKELMRLILAYGKAKAAEIAKNPIDLGAPYYE